MQVHFCLVLVPLHRVTQYTESYFHMPPTITRCYGDEMIAFFAAEAKAITIPLDEYIPQVVLELIACAKHLGYVTFCPSSVLFMFCV